MKKLTLIISSIALTFLASACSGEGKTRSVAEDQDLSARIWAKMLDAEKGTVADGLYREPLVSSLQQTHKAGLAEISAKIPREYPEPYFPYGELQNKNLDPGLNRRPLVTNETVELGKTLFNDKTLSFSAEHGFSKELGLSCASCHNEAQEFTDNQSLSSGIDNDLTHRNTPTLWNAVYSSTLTWSNPNFPILEMQAKIPLFNNDPIEMGLRGKERELLQKLSESSYYTERFTRLYQYTLDKSSVDYTVITSALAAYERSLIRFDSPFDLFLQGKGRLTEDAKMGARLFYGFTTLNDGSTLQCASCHEGILLSDSFQYVRDNTYFNKIVFHEKIRTPQLRFVNRTYPYFSQGSHQTLDEVLDFYAQGLRNGTTQSQPRFELEINERRALKAFLEAL